MITLTTDLWSRSEGRTCLSVLKEVVPGIARLAVLGNATNPFSQYSVGAECYELRGQVSSWYPPNRYSTLRFLPAEAPAQSFDQI
jgi:hypothetical protein